MGAPLELLTVTWSADKPNFDLLQHSLKGSSLANVPHSVVVQTEDLDLFRDYAKTPIRLRSSAEVLPDIVEDSRVHARQQQAFWGRHMTRMCTSLSRELGWPKWVRYIGWQTQQLSKLFFVSNSSSDYVLVLDSDVVVSPGFDSFNLLESGPVRCFKQLKPFGELSGKTRNWVATSHTLFDTPLDDKTLCDVYFDTPFLFHVPTLRNCLEEIERRTGRSWWQALLSLPPRRWSEFSLYKTYLSSSLSAGNVEWLDTERNKAIYSAESEDDLVSQVDRELGRADFVIVHSQNAGRQKWNFSHAIPRLKELVTQHQLSAR